MKVHIHTKEKLDSILAKIAASKLPITIESKKYVEKRSLPQNSLFHKWCGFVAKEFAMSGGKFYALEMWKDHFKELFGVWEEIEMLGKKKMVLKSTADYDVKEMSAFMEKIDHYCGSEFYIFVPSPSLPDNEY